MTPAELLSFLTKRGGREFAVTVCTQQGRRTGVYHLTARGEDVQVTGPSRQTRLLSPATFLEVFGGYEFCDVQPTGVLTDLGPLFG
ncbi:hypothetical protein [Deinococcus sp. YIM 77859]|uniref:hypothetical protein n=1 Tax=Deinococcus sp. YIM 77859 TaxID=1540221 RepID=UPI00054FBBA9|nr:hypothetical protein [Deinococcus sp. YIM 77859]